MRPRFEVADVLAAHWDYIDHSDRYNPWQKRTLRALKACRTAELGGHIDRCDACGHLELSYNSCRNRHCPKCQGHEREKWIDARETELLPVKYFHVVFTLPDKLNGLCMAHPKDMYDLLFATAWDVINTFSHDHRFLAARTGMFAILHTWGQNLSLHPHLHCVVPAGGLSRDGKWKHARNDGKFLFPVKAMSKVFRARYVEGVRRMIKEKGWPADKALMQSLFDTPWVVFAKQPFFHTKQVVEYLGRYTHKIAISNHRIRSIADDKVSFTWKDYRHGDRKGIMSLEAREFIRRFALHILPKRFVRIRHYGILSSTSKGDCLQKARECLGVAPEPAITSTKEGATEAVSSTVLRICPCCKKPALKTIFEFDPSTALRAGLRGPPKELHSCLTSQKKPDTQKSKSR